MKYTCPNGHGSSDIFPLCHTCEAKMVDNTAEAPKVEEVVEPVIVEEVKETPKKKK